MTQRRQFLQTSVALASGLLTTTAFSQAAWPAKPINYLVAFPAGGTTDILARLVSQKLGTALGTTLVIENCLLYTSPSPRDRQKSRMPSSA